jgi:hypothetical protein
MTSTTPTADSGSLMMIRRDGWSSIAWLAGVVALGGLLLLIPLPQSHRYRLVAGLLDLGHVPLMAALAWAMLRVLGRRGWVLGAAVGLAAGGEFLQWLAPSRSPDWGDFVHGSIGAVLAWIWTGPSRGATLRRASATAVLLAVPLVDRGPSFYDVAAGHLQFPVLADFSTRAQEMRWSGHGAKVTREQDAIGHWVGRMTFLPGKNDFPGAEFFPIEPDWSSYRELLLTLEVDVPIELCVSIKDRRVEQGYAHRFNDRRRLTPGEQTIRWNLEEVARGAGAAPLDRTRMDCVNLFVENREQSGSIVIRSLRLEK